ncbi:MAG: hypothetical protein ABIA93_03945 [Candidatus Woesearchaeota archaeon]
MKSSVSITDFLKQNKKGVLAIFIILAVLWAIFITFSLYNAPVRCYDYAIGIPPSPAGGCEKVYSLALQEAILPTILFVLAFLMLISLWYFLKKKK